MAVVTRGGSGGGGWMPGVGLALGALVGLAIGSEGGKVLRPDPVAVPGAETTRAQAEATEHLLAGQALRRAEPGPDGRVHLAFEDGTVLGVPSDRVVVLTGPGGRPLAMPTAPGAFR